LVFTHNQFCAMFQVNLFSGDFPVWPHGHSVLGWEHLNFIFILTLLIDHSLHQNACGFVSVQRFSFVRTTKLGRWGWFITILIAHFSHILSWPSFYSTPGAQNTQNLVFAVPLDRAGWEVSNRRSSLGRSVDMLTGEKTCFIKLLKMLCFACVITILLIVAG
jgi:hypothetical protein